MSTVIYVYTGTGNSLWAARRLAERLGDTTIIPVTRATAVSPGNPADRVGLVFPVHMWCLPGRIRAFLDTLPVAPGTYYFAVAVNAGQVAATLLQLRDILAAKRAMLSAGYDLVMPSNYIPFGGPGPEEKWRARIAAADEKLGRIAPEIAAKKPSPLENGPLWQRLLLTPIGKMGAGHVNQQDGYFRVDDTCTSCGVCANICPAKNIAMTDGRPAWNHRCEQCLACLQWCPAEAIQFGKGSRKRARYRNPEVTIADMLACAPE